MADKSAIEWTDATWNPFRGCSRISPGCQNCYAERMAALAPILARLEMPAGGFSRTQDVMIQASELVVLQAALAGEVKP